MTLPERRRFRYKFGTAVFDEHQERLTVAGSTVKTQPRQRALLSAFLRRRGTILSWEDLLDEAWGTDEVLDDNAVRMAVLRLRRNLGDNCSFIETISGAGYSFVGAVELEEVFREIDTGQNLRRGDTIPRRPEYLLAEHLGGSVGVEVWLAQKPFGGEKRVFKISSDRVALKDLKREFVLAQAVQQQLGSREDIARVVSLDVAEIPYVLEAEYGGVDLAQWASEGIRLAAMSREQRLALFVDIATAVAALHSVPLCHGDLKPGNVLIADGTAGPRVRLVDFGSSVHLDPARLAEIATATVYPLAELDDKFRRGTLPYMSPARRAGKSASPADDVYSLGVLLLQLAVGDLDIGIDSSGWEREVADSVLEADIRRATDRHEGERQLSVGQLLSDVRNVEMRRRQQQRDDRVRKLEQRRPWVLSLMVALTAGLVSTAALYVEARAARDEQVRQSAITAAMSRVFIDEFIRAADPSIGGRRNLTVADATVAASSKVDQAFGSEAPAVRAQLHLAMLRSLVGLQQYPQAVKQAPRATEVLEQSSPQDARALADAWLLHAQALRAVGRYDDSRDALDRVALLLRGAGLEDGELAVRMWDGLALLDGNRGDIVSALTLVREAWRIASTTSNSLSPTVRDDVMFHLADIQRVSGRLNEAGGTSRVLIAQRAANFGSMDWRTCYAQAHLAGILQGQGRDEEALAMLQPAEACLETALGADSPQSVLPVRVRGNVLNDLGRFSESARARGEASRRAAAHQGERSPVAISERINQATALALAGQAGECQQVADRVVELLQPVRQGSESDIQEARFLSAHCRLDQGKSRGVAQLLSDLNPASLWQAERWPNWAGRITYEHARLAQLRGDSADARRLLSVAARSVGPPSGRVDDDFAARVRRAEVALQADTTHREAPPYSDGSAR